MTVKLLDLAAQARWLTARLVSAHNTAEEAWIPFQGSDADPRGFVRVDNIQMEDGKAHRALRMHPKWVDKGTIKGFFPWTKMPADAVFEASVGFVSGANHTDGVQFQVWAHFMEDGRERWYRVGDLSKPYSGKLAGFRCDLSRFSGQNVALELRCDAINRSTQDWAAWIDPRVVSSKTVGDVPVSVALERFYCHNADEDGWLSNGDEPYLFVFVIVIDGYGIRIDALDQASVRIQSAPRTHNNLNKSGVRGGQNFPIPADTGQFTTHVKPVQPIPPVLPIGKAKEITQVAVAVIAMEEDGTSTSAVNSARKKILSSLQTRLNTLLRDKIKAAISGGSAEVSKAELDAIVAAVRTVAVDTIKNETLKGVNIAGIVDPDDYIGSEFGIWSYSALEHAGWRGIPISWHFKKSGVHYQITGKLGIG